MKWQIDNALSNDYMLAMWICKKIDLEQVIPNGIALLNLYLSEVRERKKILIGKDFHAILPMQFLERHKGEGMGKARSPRRAKLPGMQNAVKATEVFQKKDRTAQ